MARPRSFPNDLCLHSPRLWLRPMRHADAPQWLTIMSDPVVMRYWHHAPWQFLAEAEGALAADREGLVGGCLLKLGMYRRDTDALIGMCQLFNIDDASRRGEIGYCLSSALQGRGYMDEALTCFIDYLAHTLHMRRLEAEIDPRNSGSARTLERQGFVREGTLRARWCVNGVLSDSAIYGLLLEPAVV
ncbi:GNAT family N-acetyltransferase [Pseudomonas capeferrum]|uniref:GNAT family N-acetyltransferase n=1 Tax=Pseudomonas capeferrum TaxID=1495066 RepID=UPI0015E2CECC|nr:GNAT family protein [Pseudomonas capeferrum]MBA1201893.1 GNAT family N-acetyltransferase [Pseudomonas capeferrum]